MRRKTGQIGELYAVHYLLCAGYMILKQNYYTRYGEIDIIAKKNNKLFFIEVKTRKSNSFGEPDEAFTSLKAFRMKKSIFTFFRIYKIKDWQADLIAISMNSFDEVQKIRHYKNVSLS